MSVRPIVKWGTPVLHAPARPVEEVDDAIRGLLRDMLDTMYAAPGIGLAAPQIGVPLRVIVVDLSVGADPGQLIQLVNPVFLVREGEQKHEEGCLSVPGYGGTPRRPARVVVQGLDPRDSWDRYFRVEGEATDQRTVRATIAWILSLIHISEPTRPY